MSEYSARDWLLSNNKYAQGKLHPFTNKSARTISFTSGKGGVGKTSLALKTASLLAEEGKRVLLIDCDYNLSNSILKLGFPLNNNFYHLISAEKTFDECIYCHGNLHILSGCNGDLDLFEKGIELDKIIIDIMAAHEHSYDYIILDCPAGIGKDMLLLSAYCDYRFFVVTPDKSSITDSYSLIKILNNKYGIKENHLLVNKVSSRGQYNRIIKSICETVENFLSGRIHILGHVKYDIGTVDRFDSILLKNTDSEIHNDISKIVKKFTDEGTTGAFSDTPLEKP